MRKAIGVVVVLLLSRGAAGGPFGVPADAELEGAAAVKLAPPAVSPPTLMRMGENVERMEKLFVPLDYDPRLRAAELGGGVGPSFEYVRDKVRFEAYPGVLRGSRGTYLSRAGNAPDRAALLAGLLAAKGIECRFVTGRLGDAECEKLFERMFEAGASEAGRGSGSGEGSELAKAIRARAVRDYAAIRGVLGDQLPGNAAAERGEILKEISAHAWVRAKVGADWVDLDPSFADAKPGRAYCKAGQISAELPAELFQRVTVRVVAEMLDGASLQKQTLLEATIPAAGLIERQVFLVHAPPGGLEAVGKAMGERKDQWAPLLWVDGEVTLGKPVAFNDAPGSPDAGALGGVLGAFGDDKPASSPQIVGETLEFELSRPGAPAQTVRRILLDRGGAAWRKAAPDAKALRPLERDGNGPVAPQTIHCIWFSATRHDMAAYTDAMGLMTNAMRGGQAAEAQDDLGRRLWPIAMQNLGCAIWSDQAFIPALNDRAGVRLYPDSPRIVMWSVGSRKDPSSPEDSLIQMQVDLRRDNLRGVAKDASGGPEVARRKLWYGALEGALEHELIAAQASMMTEGGTSVSSTSSLLADGGATLLTPRDASRPWQDLAGNKDTAARIFEALSGGETLVVPKGALASADGGWWAASPAGDWRAVWGTDTHGSNTDIGGRIIRKNFPSGSPNGGDIYKYNPKTGGIDRYRPKQSGARGNEYVTILATISTPGGAVIRITLKHAVVAAVVAATAYFLYDLFK